MKVRILSLGLYEKFDFNNQTSHIHSIQIKNYFDNVEFQFRFDLNSSEKYKINASYCSFNPSTVESKFYKNHFETNADINKINRKPGFYVFILPYPWLQKKTSESNFPHDAWAFNCEPYKNGLFNNDSQRKKRFSKFSFQNDFNGQVLINNNRHTFINNFIDNNCYPLFVETDDELMVLINDYNIFLKSTLNIEIGIQNLGKIVIPFFELTSDEVSSLLKEESDDLPFN